MGAFVDCSDSVVKVGVETSGDSVDVGSGVVIAVSTDWLVEDVKVVIDDVEAWLPDEVVTVNAIVVVRVLRVVVSPSSTLVRVVVSPPSPCVRPLVLTE